MLSICGSIYDNGNIVKFVRSVLDHAKNPDEIEFSVVEDEAGSYLMTKSFNEIREMTPRLNVIQVTKEERVAYFEHCLDFYAAQRIFPARKIIEMRRRLHAYVTGEIPRIWFPPTRNYNKAVEASTGDVIVITPLDLKVPFDLSECYSKFKAAMNGQEYLSLQFGLKEGNQKRCHGIRIFNRATYEALKQTDPNFSSEPFSFDERWFTLGFYEDEWNERARLLGARSVGWEELFGEARMFEMPPSPWFPEYLCRDMAGNVQTFNESIAAYLSRPASPPGEGK